LAIPKKRTNSMVLVAPNSITVIAILVEKKTVDTCVYTHMAEVSAWSHAGGVEKKAYPTPKQAPKTVAKTKQNSPLKQSCGRIKTVFST
jgi:hypothetical protein